MTEEHDYAATEPVRPARRARGALALGLAATSLAVLAACSSGSDTTAVAASGTSAASSPTTAAAPTQAASTAYDQCMQQNGVTKPAGGPQGGTGTPPSDGAAPAAGSTPPSGAPSASGQQAAPPGVDAATFQRAQTACKSVAGAPTR